MEKVSIVVPCYNVENYIEECLDSLCRQTYHNIEIICINDGSTDHTLKQLMLYKQLYDNITMIVVDQQNRGLSEARNAGIRLATGKYIMFIDSDDFIEPDTVEKGVKAFNEDLEIDCVSFGMRAFADEDGVDLSSVKSLNGWLSHKFTGIEVLDFHKAYKTNANVCNKMYRLEDIKGKIEFIPNVYYEDIYFSWIMFFRTRKMYYLDGIQYHYRIRPKSIMTDTQSTKDFEKAMHHFYNWDKLIRDLSYDRGLFNANKDNLLRLLKKYAWQIAYYSPDDAKDCIEQEHQKRINWLTEIYNSYKELYKEII